MEQLIIYGAGGLGRELHQLVKDLAAAGRPIKCAGFFVDVPFASKTEVHNLPVFSDVGSLAENKDIRVTIAIAATDHRRRIATQLEKEYRLQFTTLIHPRAWVGEYVQIGIGSIVCAGALITADIIIGKHAQIHVGCTIGHDAKIGDFVTITPGSNIGGRVEIGEGSFIGSGAVILPRLKIGRGSIVGAGAVVTKNVPDGATVVGVPARVISKQEPGQF